MAFFTSAFVTFTVAMLFVGMLGGIYGHGRKHVFLGGFAIGAWAYLVVAYGIADLDQFGSQMLTAQAISFAKTTWLNEPQAYALPIGFDALAEARMQLDYIANCVFTLILGLVSALMARRFAHDTSQDESAAHSRFKLFAKPMQRREPAASSRGN